MDNSRMWQCRVSVHAPANQLCLLPGYSVFFSPKYSQHIMLNECAQTHTHPAQTPTQPHTSSLVVHFGYIKINCQRIDITISILNIDNLKLLFFHHYITAMVCENKPRDRRRKSCNS